IVSGRSELSHKSKIVFSDMIVILISALFIVPDFVFRVRPLPALKRIPHTSYSRFKATHTGFGNGNHFCFSFQIKNKRDSEKSQSLLFHGSIKNSITPLSSSTSV